MSGEAMRRLVIRGLVALRRGLAAAAWLLGGLLQIVLALLIVLEEWGWRPLAHALGRLARWRPWAALETWIARLPPYLALVAFALPSTLLLPLKFLALFLVAKGYYVLSVALFLIAKAVATALVARLFLLTRPALMSIGWFAWGYETLMPWKEALVAKVRSSMVWRMARALRRRAMRALRGWWESVEPRVRIWGVRARALGRRALSRIRAALRGAAGQG